MIGINRSAGCGRFIPRRIASWARCVRDRIRRRHSTVARVTLQDAVLLQPVRGEVLEGLSLAEVVVRREDNSLAFQPILSARTTRRNL